MSEHPILFSGPMVRAILEGHKTMTRRVITPQPWMPANRAEIYNNVKDGGIWVSFFANEALVGDANVSFKYGHPGDILYVRESCSISTDKTAVMYADSGGKLSPSAPPNSESWAREWKSCPSIHMPRWASRLTLEIVSVRVERVQDITANDALEEGVHLTEFWTPKEMEGKPFEEKWWDDFHFWRHYPQIAFSRLWNSINAVRGYGWDVNPWVWCISFKRVEGKEP